MSVPSGPIPSFTPGKGLQDGSSLQKLAGLLGSTSNIVAKAGGTKAAATLVTGTRCRITTCVTNGDSIILPPGYPGLQIEVFNGGAANAQVFGSGEDTINGIATGVGVTQNSGLSATYTCYEVSNGVGIWGRNLSA